MTAIETCRTAVLGGHVERCDAWSSAHRRIAFCANRHCPRVSASLRACRVDRSTEPPGSPSVPIFTSSLPSQPTSRTIAPRTKRGSYGISFRATAEDPSRTIAADPQHLGARIGFVNRAAQLGTDRRAPSASALCRPGRRPSPDGARWVAITGLDSFCRSACSPASSVVCSLHDLQAAYGAGTLRLVGPLEALQQRPAWTRTLAAMRQTEWVVYAKRPFAGPQQVVDYVGRYTHPRGHLQQSVARHGWGLRSASPIRGLPNRLAAVAKNDDAHAPRRFIRRFLLRVLPGSRLHAFVITVSSALAIAERSWLAAAS